MQILVQWVWGKACILTGFQVGPMLLGPRSHLRKQALDPGLWALVRLRKVSAPSPSTSWAVIQWAQASSALPTVPAANELH